MKWVENASNYTKMVDGSFKVAAMSGALAKILASIGTGECVNKRLTEAMFQYFHQNQEDAANIREGANLYYTTGEPQKDGEYFLVPFTMYHD